MRRDPSVRLSTGMQAWMKFCWVDSSQAEAYLVRGGPGTGKTTLWGCTF